MARKKFNEPPTIPNVETPLEKRSRLAMKKSQANKSKFDLNDIRNAANAKYGSVQIPVMNYETETYKKYVAEWLDGDDTTKKTYDWSTDDTTEENMADPKPRDPRPKKYQRLQDYNITDTNLPDVCNNDCSACWEKTTCEWCEKQSEKILELSRKVRDNVDAAEQIEQAKEKAEKYRLERDNARNLLADLASVLGVDLGDGDGDRWATDNLRKIVGAAKDIHNNLKVAESERDRFNREADHLAEAHEAALDSADYWREMAKQAMDTQPKVLVAA